MSDSTSPAQEATPTSSGSSTLESVLALLVKQPQLAEEVAKLQSERDEYKVERDEYKVQYLALLEAYRKLELGIVGQKRERFISGQAQEVFQAVLESLKLTPGTTAETVAQGTRVEAHTRVKPTPTGKQPLPEELPRVEVTVLPPEVERLGLDAFTKVGEDVKETIEKRAAAFVVVRTVRPIFKPKEAKADARRSWRRARRRPCRSAGATGSAPVEPRSCDHSGCGLYNTKHHHSAIRFVTPDQRHFGHETQLLAKRSAVYELARRQNPNRWSRHTRNWSPAPAVRLGPVRAAESTLESLAN